MNTNQHLKYLACTSLIYCVVAFVGCSPREKKAAQKDNSIIGKKTQEIGEFDANKHKVVEDNGDNVNIITGAAGAYTPTISKIAKMQIQQSLNFFKAEHGRFPKDHAEFMKDVVKKYQIQLPKLPAKFQYRYDVENHELLRVEVSEDDTTSSN